MKSASFETRDHELASILVTTGRVVDHLRWEKQEDGRPFGIFVFIGDLENLDKVADDFFAGKEFKISPRELFANHKMLRTWLYDSRDRMKKDGET